MPHFDDSITTSASAVQIWKLLYDPLRFPQWWAGITAATSGDARGGGPGDVTLWAAEYPDLPLPQLVETRSQDHRVVVSCIVTDLVFEWRLEPADGGTSIAVHVEVPEKEAARLTTQREVVSSSLRRLAALAEAD